MQYINNVCSNKSVYVNNKTLKYIKNSLSIPPLPNIYNNTNNNNNKKSSSVLAVKKIDQSARVLGMSSRQSVTNGKAAHHAATSTPVLSNADSGATGNYIRLADIADFVNFWHATFGSPAVSTFIAAIDKGFIREPGLTAAKVRRHTPNSVATAYGHLHATRQGYQVDERQSEMRVARESAMNTL